MLTPSSLVRERERERERERMWACPHLLHRSEGERENAGVCTPSSLVRERERERERDLEYGY